jgi:hypothetical protein
VQGAYPTREKLAQLAGLEAPNVGLKVTVEQTVSESSACCSGPAVKEEVCCDETSEKKSNKKSSCC